MSDRDETAISVNKVYKDFVLPHERKGSVKGIFTSMFREVTKERELQHALKDISFNIKKGEFFGIVGRNGSGKSTLLKILANIYQPTKGSVSTSGKLVPFIELGVGFNPELSGRDNVYLNGAVLGFSEKQVDLMYDEIVDFAELGRFMDQKLKNYSSGMQVRLAFSMAVRANADILLIDEVLAVGDADFQRKCYEYFNQLKRQGKTVVFVSHQMDAVQKYCDRAILIENNSIIKAGSAVDVAEEYIKLFMTNSDNSITSQENRWGDGRLQIKEISVKEEDNFLVIKEKIVSNADIKDPSAGIRIKSTSGQQITGTSSEIEKTQLPSLKKGDMLNIEWRMPNILSDSQYYAEPALAYGGGTTIADWWDEAVLFTVKKRRALPYPVDPDFILKVTRADKK